MDRLRVHVKASERQNYSPKVDRPSMPSPALRRPSITGDLPMASPSIQRLMNWGMKQTLCSENVLKSATLAQLKLLQEDVVNWVARRQGEPLLRLKFDNVTKRVGVAAVGLHLPQASFHAAWGLPPAHDEFIEFIGLRAPDGEEIPFEELEESGEAVLVNWEERLREDNVYSLLYLDSREEMGDLLTAEERQQILSEFDSIDVNQTGSVTTQEVQAYVEKRMAHDLAGIKSELADLHGKGDAGKRAADEKERLLRAKAKSEAEQLLLADIDEDGTIELHEYFRSRSQQILAARGVNANAAGGRKKSVVLSPRDLKSPRESAEAAFCPNCGKGFISAFCTGCGTSRGDGPGKVETEEKKKIKKKVIKKKVTDAL